MKALVLFSVDFCEWPLAFLDSLVRLRPELAVSGIVVIDRSIHDYVARQSAHPIEPLHSVVDLEREWLAATPQPGRLACYEEILGRDAVAQIGISHRELSAGWVTGAVTPSTPLMLPTTSSTTCGGGWITMTMRACRALHAMRRNSR